ncbi:hypothetical protein B0H66DRAFT_551467 [Apodospora peruviana]|uniref:Uncharacterized protein n=1 Tax=Apodospora peruviana TaxID=516989 RepID=A0AAE0MC12_9PEZI|nr:hypothetical protein B0H66DRAFT_551467 [Apodospora peruviana]
MAPVNLSSGILHFGNTCPGTLMQRLLRENRSQVQKIKKLQTAFSLHPSNWGCPIGARDASEVTQFIQAIPRLEELDIYNYVQNFDVLWPAIFHHAASLGSLAIHSPPQFVPKPGGIWTAEAVKRVADELLQLRRLDMDIDTDTAKAAVKAITTGSVLDEVANMSQLKSLRVSIVLLDTESIFAGDNKPNAFGSRMPNPNDSVCMNLARKIFNKFHEKDAGAALTEVELRLTRRAWEDRGQFSTMKYSYLAVKKGHVAEPSKKKAGEKGKVPAVRRYNLRSQAPVPQPHQDNQPDVKVTAEGPWRCCQPACSSNVENIIKVLVYEPVYSRYL